MKSSKDYEIIYFIGGALDGVEITVIGDGKSVYMMPLADPRVHGERWMGSKAIAVSIYRRRRGTSMFDYGRIILN